MSKKHSTKHHRKATRTRKQKIRALLAHPWVVIIPVVALLWMGWQYYLTTSRPVNVSTNNLLSGGSFESLGRNGLPEGWRLSAHNGTQVTTNSPKGYTKGKALGVYIRDYKGGEVTLETPQVKVQPGKQYLFKGYYLTTTPFDLLARLHYKDGTTRLEVIREYPANNDPWSTVSYALRATPDLQAVEMVYRLDANGDLQLDDTYFEQKDTGLYLPLSPEAGTNLIPNPSLSAADGDHPQDWITYHAGANTATFDYLKENGNPAVRTTVRGYKDGEAKWQYLPLPVKPGQSFAFSVDYHSSTTAELTAEYELEDGQRTFERGATLRPTREWTHSNAHFEVPKGAKNMFVSAILHDNGTLTTDNYDLHETTRAGKNGQAFFDRPLVSVTFDDGWQSAYTNGAALLDKFDVPGTFYLNSSTINTGIFMNQGQLADLAKRGHQLAAHGDEHIDMTAINATKLQKELTTTYDYLHKTFRLKRQDFATPYGKSDAEVEYLVRKYYRSHRGTDTGINTKQNFNPYNLQVMFVTKDTPLVTIQEALTSAKEKNGWLILVYHRIENNPQSSTTITPATFTQHLEAIKQQGLPVATVEQALNELQKQ